MRKGHKLYSNGPGLLRRRGDKAEVGRMWERLGAEARKQFGFTRKSYTSEVLHELVEVRRGQRKKRKY